MKNFRINMVALLLFVCVVGTAWADGEDVVEREEKQTDEPDKWVRILPDGSKLKLLAVFNPKEKTRRFWEPDGNLIKKHGYLNQFHDGNTELAVVLEYDTTKKTKGQKSASGSISRFPYNQYNWQRSNKNKPLKVLYGRSYGQWEEMGVISEGRDLGYYHIAEVKDISNDKTNQIRATMYWHFNPDFCIRLVAVDNNNKEYQMSGGGPYVGRFEKGQQTIYSSNAIGLTKKDLSHFKLQKRPLTWIVFTDFAIEPKNDVQADSKTLEKELHEIDKLRLGEETPFEQAENMCNELLEKYTEPKEQGKIYYQLAVVYSQSGPIPDKTIEFAKKALEFPLDPFEQLKLYVWWGDAIQVAHSGVSDRELVAARRKAVIPYLRGLKKSLHFQYPAGDTQPEHLPEEQNVTTNPRDPAKQMRQKIWAEQRKALEDWKRARFEGDVKIHKMVLTSQISTMYSRSPRASDEIRELATKILEDKTAVDNLMSAIDETGENNQFFKSEWMKLKKERKMMNGYRNGK